MERVATKTLILTGCILLALNGVVWRVVFAARTIEFPQLYFLDVGQGDSSLVVLPGGVQVLIDGGPDARVLDRLEEIMPIYDRSIDLVVLTHPQTDHLSGLIDVLRRYRVGAFLYNGDGSTIGSYVELVRVLKEKKIRTVVVDAGDSITYGANQFDVIWPDSSMVPIDTAQDPNDRSVVLRLASPYGHALFTGDIGSNMDAGLLRGDVEAEVLKVPHHGSKFASSKEFLDWVRPLVSVVEVGAKNKYGHPTPQVLDRLAAIGSRIFRTDRDGTVEIEMTTSTLKTYIRGH